MKKYCCYIFILFIFSACAPSRFVKPLSKGEKAINLSAGGPLIAFSGLVIPIPLTTITGGYGLTESTTIFASWHTTSALFQTGQTEIGIVKQIIPQKNFMPALSTNVVGNFIFNKSHVNFYPQVDINAYWHYLQQKNFFYVGFNNWFELQQTRTQHEVQTDHWMISPQIGHTFVHNTWHYTFECKYVAINKSHENLVVEYKSLTQMGAIGLYFGISKKF